MNKHDVIIIGSGTAGQTAAYELIAHGLSVAVVEQSETPGGTCALAGCQAKKWFYEGMELIARARHLQDKGVEHLPVLSWAELKKQKNLFTSRVPKGTLAGFEKASIDVIAGKAAFISDNTIECNGQKYTAQNFIIATGAETLTLPIPGAEHMISSREFLELDDLPGRIVFIGGGFISFEFAHFVARLNPSNEIQTTILEVAPRPLGPFDEDMVEQLMLASEMDGIDIMTETSIQSIEVSGLGYLIKMADSDDLEADLVVNGAGRKPALDGLGLEKAGIDFTRRGISVDEKMRTAQKHIFAVGDCAVTLQLARVADYEAMIAANVILVDKGDKGNAGFSHVDQKYIPAILFTYPQYGMVGHTEQSLIDSGIEYIKTENYDLTWPGYQRIGMDHAAYKILASPSGDLLGAHFLSDHASGMLNTIRLAMLNGINVEKLYRQMIMSPYPTRESDLTYMLKPLLLKTK